MKTVFLAGVAAVFLSTVAAQSASKLTTAVSTQDFVSKVAMSDMYEIKASELISKSDIGDEKTKAFANKMIEDHTKTSEALKQQLQSQTETAQLPADMSADQQAMLNKLSGLKGAELRKEYIREQVAAHQEAVKLFQSYSMSGDNKKLKKWALATLPALKEHLHMVHQLRKS